MSTKTQSALSEELIQEVLAYLEEKPWLLSDSLVFKGLSRLVINAANGASILEPSGLQKYLDYHPEENFLLRAALDAYALTHGLRLIDDKLVSISIREGKKIEVDRKNRGWFTRIGRAVLNLDKKEVTTLIREHEKLAAEILVLETSKAELQSRLSDLRKEADTLLDKTRAEAQKTFDDACRRAESLVKDASDRAERILKDALATLEKTHQEKSCEITKLQAKIADLEKEVAEKQAILAELNTNPEIVKEWVARRAELKKVQELAQAPTHFFADEETKSEYGYKSGYKQPIPVADQIDILRRHWPKLDPDKAIKYYQETYAAFQLPNWVEGPFAIIRPGFFSDKYGEELEEILAALAKDRNGNFYNYRAGKLEAEYLKQIEQALEFQEKLRESQGDSDIFIVSAQLGIRHRGRSVRRVRELCVGGEYGVGAKDAGTMLLTHPDRMRKYGDLFMDCSTDEYDIRYDKRFEGAPCFDFGGSRLLFDALGVSTVDADFGSASFFLPH